jgi:hypothetical protein
MPYADSFRIRVVGILMTPGGNDAATVATKAASVIIVSSILMLGMEQRSTPFTASGLSEVECGERRKT